MDIPPIYVGSNTQTVSSVPGFRAVMKCLFESYPTPEIQWIKMARTSQEPEGRILASDIDQGVNDITTKQIGSTLWETVLSYTPNERDFGFNFECRATNRKTSRHSFTLQKSAPPRAVYPTEAKPLANAIELVVHPPETGGLPLVQYVVKYEQIGANQPDSMKTLIFPAQTMNGEQTQILRIDNLQPSTAYSINILAETRAGIGQSKAPIRLKTLDRQIPQFKLLSTTPEEQMCIDDHKCLIKWSIESDGGAPISKAEIFYAKSKDDSSLEIVDKFSDPQTIDPLKTEYELTNLQPNTNYIIAIRLYNEAGPAEQKIRKQTKPIMNGNIYSTLKPDIKKYRRGQPSKWIIFGIVFGIVATALVVILLCVLIRICRIGANTTKTNDIDNPTTPMMNGENHSDISKTSNGYKNGQSPARKVDDSV
ncbi:unnamed protein product [Didymodactylos carnosus]|uniref:Uncharacterized protein n=1 Tax=Didymodactylos carnosus TaxID=1234261 RepID=A0A8S2ELL6_9BILA|nr:unnamed protein product [Didymodactylos carnosus]CAF3990898.1 unnamed protein product [Didymodactylos carnosus]